MKKFIYITIAFIFLIVGCGKKSLIQEKLSQADTYCVISLKEGNDIVIPTSPITLHDKQVSFRGSELQSKGVQIWLTNGYFHYYPMGCTGCDSCMRCYEKEGLITYKVKEQLENEVIADIHLTSKGKKYLIQNMVETDTTLVNEVSAQNIALVTTLYTTHKAKNITRLSDGEYLFDKITIEHCTPFATAIGISLDSLKTREERSEAYIVDMKEYESEEYINGYSVDIRQSSLWYHLTTDGYNLDSCKSFKNALLQHFQLTDTLASVNLFSYDWCNGKGYRLYFAGEYFSTEDKLPDYFTKSVIYHEGEGIERKYLTLGSCYELDKIIKKHKYKQKELKEGAHYNKTKFIDLDITKEVVFRVKRTMSPLDQKQENSESNSIIYYVRCPYIEFDNYIYFINDEFWCEKESDLYTKEYPDHYRYGRRIPITKPFEEICSTLSQQ